MPGLDSIIDPEIIIVYKTYFDSFLQNNTGPLFYGKKLIFFWLPLKFNNNTARVN